MFLPRAGVLFTRNPANGTNELYGEFLLNAQGEDVVAGIRTPMPISVLKEKMPTIYQELHDTVKMLERHMHDMQVGTAASACQLFQSPLSACVPVLVEMLQRHMRACRSMPLPLLFHQAAAPPNLAVGAAACVVPAQHSAAQLGLSPR
jgi:hypothetical protein